MKLSILNFNKDKDIEKRIEMALDDKTLYANLSTFSYNIKKSYKKVYEGLNFDYLRAQVNKSKEFDKDERLELFKQFKQNVEKGGAKVYQANDSISACKYITAVCKNYDAEYVVKSKSMTAEEIELNKYLESNGIHPIETDLGEWILQLANEKPSHMVAPAIHKNRKQVAELFRQYTKEDIDENDIEKMVKIARKYLRDYFFKAKVGITGANIAVAQTGTIAIFTNEGNAELTTTIPPVHIILLGYDKLVKNFEQAMKITRVLPKNAAGQIMATYVTWIKGQYPSSTNATGIKETHYVFLDNGRLSLFNNPTVKEAFKCIRCGSCANVCPVYGVVGGHVFGDIYTGPIGVVNTVLYGNDQKAKDLLKLCLGCKACSEICPANIDIQKLISDLNIGLSQKYHTSSLRKFTYSNLLSKANTFHNILKIGSYIQTPLQSENKNYIKFKNISVAKNNTKNLPLFAKKTFSELFKQYYKESNGVKKVFFYPGCAIEYFYPDIGIALMKLLQKAKIDIDIPEKAVCCGFPAIHSGEAVAAKKIILENIQYMKNLEDYDAFLILCPTCGSQIKNYFPSYLSANIKEFKKTDFIISKMKSLSMFLDENKIRLIPKNNFRITYHIPCHQARSMHFSAESLLMDIFKENFIPLDDADVCCGFGGSFSIDHPNISNAILDKKINNIIKTKADIILTDCPGCIMQIKSGIIEHNLNIKVMHLSDFFQYNVDIL